MSWFADFAGKAEDFLNKVDQGAATALTINQEKASSFSSYEEESPVKPEFNPAAFKTMHLQLIMHIHPLRIHTASSPLQPQTLRGPDQRCSVLRTHPVSSLVLEAAPPPPRPRPPPPRPPLGL
ncbi:hypothetical protein KUCAC02_036627 [Chaenocephalus aceratus]|nr:hypothetical protein KUCAC02_036627 [Chaenocephalus aceratus]